MKDYIRTESAAALSVLCLFVGLFVGLFGGGATVNARISKLSLQGYSAHATYTTNEVGEVKIGEIKWIK